MAMHGHGWSSSGIRVTSSPGSRILGFPLMLADELKAAATELADPAVLTAAHHELQLVLNSWAGATVHSHHGTSSQAHGEAAELRAAVKQLSAPGGQDDVTVWTSITERLKLTRDSLQDAQAMLRALAPTGTAHIPDKDALDAVIALRDERRTAHIEQLRCALGQHEAKQVDMLYSHHCEEAVHLEGRDMGTGAALGARLTAQLRLAVLKDELLPPLHAWMQQMPALRSELDDLEISIDQRDVLLDMTTLCRRGEAWKAAAKQVRFRIMELDDGEEGADVAVREARRAVQRSERELRQERARLTALSVPHYPELLVREQFLRLGAPEGAALHRVLVERKLEEYSPPEGEADLVTLSQPRANHLVQRCASPPTVPRLPQRPCYICLTRPWARLAVRCITAPSVCSSGTC